MQIVSASFSLDTSYQLDLKSASVTASAAKPADPAPAAATATAPPAPPASDSYLASPQTPVRHGHGHGHGGGHGLKGWMARLEDKLEKGDVAGAEQQIGQILTRIAQQLEKTGNTALKLVTQSNQAPATDATVSGSAVQFHDEAKVALSLSFQTSDGQQYSIEAAIDVSRTLARQQVSVPQAA